MKKLSKKIKKQMTLIFVAVTMLLTLTSCSFANCGESTREAVQTVQSAEN